MDVAPFLQLPTTQMMPVRARARIAQRMKFSQEEDERLKELVGTYGSHAWPTISKIMSNGRSARQCRDRWNNYLSPDLSHEPWTQQEDQLLLKKFTEIGNHWGQIQKFFENRSINSVRNRYVKLSGSAARPMSYSIPAHAIIHHETQIRIPPPPTQMLIPPVPIPTLHDQHELAKRAQTKIFPHYAISEEDHGENSTSTKVLEMFENMKEELESWIHNPHAFNHDQEE